MTEARTRLDWIDAAKGMGIALVVLGHAARHDMMEDDDLCGFLSYLNKKNRISKEIRFFFTFLCV